MILVIPVRRQHLENAPGDVHRRRIQHGVVIGEWNVLEHHPVVVFVERCPAAVLALHRQYPVNRPLHRLALVASIGMLDATQPQANHCAVIHIRIKLVVELEVPSARLSRLDS